MDLKGLEKALGKTAEQERMTPSERVEAVRIKFFKQARRLDILARANGTNLLIRRGINIADLAESPLGAGRLSAKVINTGSRVEYGGREFVVGYSFTPDTDQPSVTLINEIFTDRTDDLRYWPMRSYDDVSYLQLTWAEDFVAPQIPVMDATATMLEEALATGLGNDSIFAEYVSLRQ